MVKRHFHIDNERVIQKISKRCLHPSTINQYCNLDVDIELQLMTEISMSDKRSSKVEISHLIRMDPTRNAKNSWK
jgi:hypothetical protein